MNEIKSKRFKHPKESSTIFQPQLQDFFNFKSKSQFNPIFRVSRIFNNQIEELWRIQESPLATWNTTKKVHPPWCPPPSSLCLAASTPSWQTKEPLTNPRASIDISGHFQASSSTRHLKRTTEWKLLVTVNKSINNRQQWIDSTRQSWLEWLETIR